MDLFTKIPSLKELIEKNQYSEALTELNKLLDVEKGNYDAYIFKARIHQLMNKDNDAIKLYEDIINKFPDKYDPYLDLIEIYELQKDEDAYKRIVTYGNKVNSIDKNETPFFQIGEAYYAMGQIDSALEAYNNAVKQKAIEIRVCSLISYNKKHDNDIIERAIRSIGDNRWILHRALFGKAGCLRQLNKLEEAIDTYKTAIALDVIRKREYESHDACQNVSEIYYMLGKEASGRFYKNKAETLEKIDKDAYDKSHGQMTEDEFNAWYDNYFEIDKNGTIIGYKKPKQ